jgi:hypothetical protein
MTRIKTVRYHLTRLALATAPVAFLIIETAGFRKG